MTQGTAIRYLMMWLLCSAAVAGAQGQQAQTLKTVGGRGPHGGIIRELDDYKCEVAIHPLGVQLYLWDKQGQPVDVSDVRAGIRISQKKNPRRQRYDLYPVVQSAEKNRLGLRADLSRIPRYGTKLQVTVHGLESRSLRVTVPYKYRLTPEQLAIKSQRICPVSGKLLGSAGTPQKVEVADRQVYVCCSACNSTLQKSPHVFLARLPKK